MPTCSTCAASSRRSRISWYAVRRERAERTAVGGPLLRGDAGAVDADGWAFRLRDAAVASASAARSITASPARAGRLARRRHRALGARAAAREDFPRGHDVVRDRDSRDGDARVHALQDQLGLHAIDTDLTRPGLDGRFDVQVNQALPFELGGTRWEVLVGVGTCSAIEPARLRLRRAPRGSAAQARGRRVPRALLGADFRGWVLKGRGFSRIACRNLHTDHVLRDADLRGVTGRHLAARMIREIRPSFC